MPVIISSTIHFNPVGKYYCNDLAELVGVSPHIEKDKNVRFYVVELRNEISKLVKRFKPFKELELKISEYYSTLLSKNILCLVTPEDVTSWFNVVNNYRIAIVITTYDGKPFLPLELKSIEDYDCDRAFECFSRIKASLLLLSLEQTILNMTISYLWDAYVKLEKNDIEGARTSVRNSLSAVKDQFIPRIGVVEGARDFPQEPQETYRSLNRFYSLWGPSSRPSPKSTTETIISMTIELIKYLV
jgi:hypothetical protein